MAKVFGDRSFGVGATRASHEMMIYTQDKEVAAALVGAKQEKLSAVENIEKDQDKAHEKGANRQIERA
jgi:type IV secretory pathway VirB9-like protein